MLFYGPNVGRGEGGSKGFPSRVILCHLDHTADWVVGALPIFEWWAFRWKG